MIAMLHFLVVVCLVVVIFEDFLYRAVHWIVFPVIFAALFVLNFCNGILLPSVKEAGANVVFIAVQLCIVIIYLWVKEGKLRHTLTGYFGLGDLLFLVSVAGAFSVANFIGFYILSLLFTLMIFAVVVVVKRDTRYAIPLAGMQSVVFMAAFIASIFVPAIQLHDNSLMLSHLQFLHL
jgi:hypothetical protein